VSKTAKLTQKHRSNFSEELQNIAKNVISFTSARKSVIFHRTMATQSLDRLLEESIELLRQAALLTLSGNDQSQGTITQVM
jgi:hypothetical protein